MLYTHPAFRSDFPLTLHEREENCSGRHKLMCSTGLETYFFRNSQTFVSGFYLDSQIAVSYSQLVLLLFQRLIHTTMKLYLLICCLQIGNDKNAK